MVRTHRGISNGSAAGVVAGGALLLSLQSGPSAAEPPAAGMPGSAVGSSVGGMQGPRYIPNSFFATTTHFNTDLLVELLGDLNLRTVRLDFAHDLLEPAAGRYAFGADNRVIQSANLGVSHGLDQLALISHPAAWLKVAGSGDMFPNDESVAAFEEFVYQIASKYKGQIRYWQAGNEPYIPAWKERYVILLKALARAVKRADPANQVVLCGFSGTPYRDPSRDPEYLDLVYQYGGKDSFDIIASHPYTWPLLLEEGRCLDTITRLHEVMVKHGDSKPLWITEIGWSGVEPAMLGQLQTRFWHRHRSRSEEDQARALARLYLVLATIPWVERVYFFHLQQEAKYTDTLENPDFYMGLFTPWIGDRIRPKDAYFAVKTVIQMIGESAYQERLALAPDLWALVFTRGDEATVALWSVGADVVLKLGDTAMVKSVTSMVGSPVLISAEELPAAELRDANGGLIVREDRPLDWDGPNTLRLSGRPLYLKMSLPDLDRFKAQIRDAQPLATPRRGGG
jgi:hypothetical protein